MPKRKEFFIFESGHLPHMENPNSLIAFCYQLLNKSFEK